MKAFLSFLLALLPSLALAYPEMVRHGYTHCTACHFSPTGGGQLTAYGRSLSREVLSTWGAEGEGDFLYGAVKTPAWMSLGGMFRAAQLHQSTPAATAQGRFIPMQMDLEATVMAGKFTFDATLGIRRPPPSPNGFPDFIMSRRYWAMVQFNEHFSLRAGRFYPAFGIHTADHVIPTRKGLGWDFGAESNNIEAAWLFDHFDVFLTGILGRLDKAPNTAEKGVAVRTSVALGDNSKLGANYLFGENATRNRHLLGAFGVIGFTHHMFLLAELDFQFRTNKSPSVQTDGVVAYARYDYEWVQGLHTYLTYEYSKLDFSNANFMQSFGAGVQFFPRPHIELNLSWSKQKDTGVAPAYYDYAWLLLHYWL